MAHARARRGAATVDGIRGSRRGRARDPRSPACASGCVDERARRSGTSGSRNGRLRCTGPAGGPWAAANARQAIARQVAPAPSTASGGPGSQNQRTASPYSLAWSIVWPAPVSRSSGGRSAVHTSIGTRACAASITAGWKLAAAVPDVHSTIAGTPRREPDPERARNAADRSSSTTCTRIARVARQREGERCRSRPGRDDCVGARRDRAHSSTSARANAVVASSPVTAPPQWSRADRVRPGLHADDELLGCGVRRRSMLDSSAVDVPRPRDLRRDRERDRRRRRPRHVCRLLDGRPPRACSSRVDRPERRDPVGAGERVARARGPRPPAPRAAHPTRIWRGTSNKSASTRSCATGSHSRCSRPCPRTRPASPTGTA